MARKIFKPLAILFALVTILAVLIISKSKNSTKYATVEIGNATVDAEIADTMAKQMRGLMFRQTMKEDEGMLFAFGKDDYYGIWMMNMSFPIDIIWIADDKVVDIAKDAQPCKMLCPTYVPKEKASYVLEVNSGFSEKHGIEIGTSVKFSQLI